MTEETDDSPPTCKILWGITGSLGIQPMLIVGLTGLLEEQRWLDVIADIARRRRPKPSDVEILGGNCEPGVLILTNESHFTREKPPRIVAWLMKQIRAELDHGAILCFEVQRHESKR